MREKLCIIDLDNRKFDEAGEVFGPDVMDWGSADGMHGVHGLSLGLLNHYVYGMRSRSLCATGAGEEEAILLTLFFSPFSFLNMQRAFTDTSTTTSALLIPLTGAPHGRNRPSSPRSSRSTMYASTWIQTPFSTTSTCPLSG